VHVSLELPLRAALPEGTAMVGTQDMKRWRIGTSQTSQDSILACDLNIMNLWIFLKVVKVIVSRKIITNCHKLHVVREHDMS
jgi:hypothetical protein